MTHSSLRTTRCLGQSQDPDLPGLEADLIQGLLILSFSYLAVDHWPQTSNYILQ